MDDESDESAEKGDVTGPERGESENREKVILASTKPWS